MQPQPLQALLIDDLDNVRGGFIGALLGAAPAILQGVTGIIQASKAGKGQPQPGPGPGGPGGPGGLPPGAESAAAAQAAAGGGMPGAGGLPPSDGSGVSVSISINGVQQRTA